MDLPRKTIRLLSLMESSMCSVAASSERTSQMQNPSVAFVTTGFANDADVCSTTNDIDSILKIVFIFQIYLESQRPYKGFKIDNSPTAMSEQ